MLSIANVNVEMASTYYEQDNYYTQQRGEYFGSLKDELGLADLTHESFQDLIRGKANGIQLIQNGANGKHRAGYDHVFTAPKKLSIALEMAEAKGNLELAEAIRKAHDQAVNSTLEHIEAHYITYNNKEENISNHIHAHHLISAKFEHDTTRELDPELHTHCVIMNITKDANGNFRAISNEELYNHKMLNGQYYRAELAKNLKELGFELEMTDAKTMLFDIKGIDQSLHDEFSRRSVQIKELLPKLREQYPKASEAELKQYAALESRKTKKDVNRDEVRQENLERASKLTDVDQLLGSLQKPSIAQEINPQAFIQKAAQILTEQKSVIDKEELFKVAMTLSLGEVGAKKLLQEIDKANLIKIDENSYTTQEMYDIEHEIIELSNSSKNTKEKLLKTEITLDTSMTDDQSKALTHILSSQDMVIGIQGDAGTGKTYMLKQLKELLNDKNIELQGLAYTGNAVDKLQEESGIASQTLHSFFVSQVKESDVPKEKVYIVDEASMIGSRHMHQLILKAQEQNARIVLIGDTKQFQAITAGAIFEQLQQRGMKTVTMEQSLRQKTKNLKECVQFIKNKETDKAFEVLEKENLVLQKDDLVGSALQSFKEDPNALLIVSKNALRTRINDAIRAHKILKNEISNAQSVQVKESINLTAQEKLFINTYHKDHIVFVNESKNGLKAGSEASIESISPDTHEITLRFKDDSIKTIDISKHGDQLSLFTCKDKSFGVGDTIAFTKNDKKLNVKNGNIGTVQALDEQGNVTIDLQGKTVSFNLKQYNYLDHGYAITDYKAQGATADNVVIIADSKMAHIKSFYTQVTRAKYKVKVITDNIEQLKENVTRNPTKSTTLDHVDVALDQARALLKASKRTHIQKLLANIKEHYQILKEKLHERIKHHFAERDQQSEHHYDRTAGNDLKTLVRDSADAQSQRAGIESERTNTQRVDDGSLAEAYQHRKQPAQIEQEMER